MSTNTVITYPISAYQNPPINPQYFRPRNYIITAIVLGPTTAITTSVNHDYVIGQLTRLIIPNGYGSTGLNEQVGYVISIPAANQVILDLNSQNQSAFISASLEQTPQILAIGDINSGAINRFGRAYTLPLIPGSFINISPA